MRRVLKTLISVLITINIVHLSYGQTPNLDDILNSLEFTKMEKVDTLLTICWSYREKDSDFSLKCAELGLVLAEEAGMIREQGNLNNYMGVIYLHYKDKARTSIPYFNKALKLSIQANDSIVLAYVYNNLGDAFLKVGNIPLAKEYGEKSLTIFKKIGYKQGIAYSYINLGMLHRMSFNYTTALDYFKQAIELRKTLNDSIGIASSTLELAHTLLDMNQPQEAMHNFKYSETLHKKLNNKNYMAYSLQGMGKVYFLFEKYDSAIVCYNQALALSIERNNISSMVNNQIGLALTYGKQNQQNKGEKYLEQALTNAHKSGNTQKLQDVFKAKAEFYLNQKDYKKASKNYQSFLSVYDSIFSQLQFQTMDEIKGRFQITEELEQIQQDLKTKKRETASLILIIVLLFGIVSVLFIRYNTRTKLSARLYASNQAKDKLFSIISHDLVSPFNVILGQSELLAEYIKNKEYENAEKSSIQINNTSNETFELIQNLLNWARSQQNKITLLPETFSLKNILNDVISIANNQALTKNISFRINIKEDISVKADKNLIKIVLTNLINNAVKFSNQNSEIEIYAENHTNLVRVEIKDHGIGISANRLNRLFSNNQPQSTPGTNNEKGTGLGIMICKEFIEKHNGIIGATSEVGKGSIFYFTLPQIN